jgi:hypothetical protein
MPELLINIRWDGPYSLAEVQKLTGPTDRGLYQVYTHHPVYGQDLVYIGRTWSSIRWENSGARMGDWL